MRTLTIDCEELDLCLLLDAHYRVDVTQGVTTRPERAARAREVILANKAGGRVLKALKRTLAQQFERVFEEPLCTTEGPS